MQEVKKGCIIYFVSLIIIVFLCLLIQKAYSQDYCGAGNLQGEFIQAPALLSGGSNILPVVVHVIHVGEPVGIGTNISDVQVFSAINSLNLEFSNQSTEGQSMWGVDTEIEFCLATIDTIGNPTTGIIRHNGCQIIPYYCDSGLDMDGVITSTISAAVRWQPMHYYNVYVVSEFLGNDGGAGLQGFAPYPHPSFINLKDGAYMIHNAFGTLGNLKPNYTKNKLIVHEIGHAFNLLHPFEGGCNNDTDFCLDTPPTSGSLGNSICTIKACNNTQMIENYMDYTHENCKNTFTECQKDRMQSAATYPQRFTQLNSGKCDIVTSIKDTDSLNNEILGRFNLLGEKIVNSYKGIYFEKMKSGKVNFRYADQ